MQRAHRGKFSGAATLAAAAFAGTAHAHGFGQRYDLPVPLWLFLTGAATAVAVSFVVMAVFLRAGPHPDSYPRIDLLRSRIGGALAHPLTLACCRAAALTLFFLVIIAGFLGSQSPVKNIAPIMVWAIGWVGIAYVSALLGNPWALVNPLNTSFAWAERCCSRLKRGAAMSLTRPYPQRLAAWPAVALFLAFAWAELVWEGSDLPANVAAAMLCYCAITWAGMFVFGREKWLRHGEAFELVFGVLARFAPTEARVVNGRTQWNLRPYAVGLLVDEPVHPSLLALVLLMLATVTFDGFSETPLWAALSEGSKEWLSRAPLPLTTAAIHTAVHSAGLVALWLLFVSVYFMFARLISQAGASALAAGRPRQHRTADIAGLFVLTLVPIAIAYHLAHYLSFLLMAGQYLIPLASDPLGFGWDLFGTTLYFVKINVIDARFVWYASVAAIVTGHIAAVYLAHAMALRVFGDKRAARRSQYPMLALMIGYTMLSLWIIAQPIVASRFG